MPNPILNFCYNIAGKREEMEVDNQENQPGGRNKRQRINARAAARKAMANDLNNIKRHNSAVKIEAYRGVRRPGKDHSRLFQTLDQLLGSLQMKKDIVREVIVESLRFKRRALAQLLEEYVVEMEMNENNQPKAVCPQCAQVRASSSCNCKGRNIG